ncbi:hypothetical protein WDW37_05620 [Bdellovibrionota bacterium FG-1]
MSPNAVPLVTENFSVLSVPGKVFLLGEYAVLSGHPGLVAAVGPRFELRLSSGSVNVHPQSPAGRLLQWAKGQEPGSAADFGFEFVDPLRGTGGFGASTAQFALLYRAIASRFGLELSAVSARQFYRDLMSDEPLPPSGVDLMAQWNGGVTFFDPACNEVRQCFSQWDWRNLLVFSAVGLPGRKVTTHEHLGRVAKNGLARSWTDRLAKVLQKAMSVEGDLKVLGAALTEYADVLCELGLEADEAYDDRQVLAGLSGVLGVKGAGAMLSDAVIVLMENGSRDQVIDVAQGRGLRLVANGLPFEKGIL